MSFIIKSILIILALFFIIFLTKQYNKNGNVRSIDSSTNIVEDAVSKDDLVQSKIDQLFIVGFRGMNYESSPELKRMIEETNIGGIILFDYDTPSKKYNRNIQTSDQVRDLITNAQANARTGLFVAIDEEGGLVSRLKSIRGYIKTPSANILGTLSDTEVFNVGKSIGTVLEDLGFNMNFAPVLDINVNKKSSIIGSVGRSFSSDKNIVAEKAISFSNGLLSEGIITVGKHFPGHGSAIGDTHLGFVDITDTYKEYEKFPFEKACSSGMKAIMVGHLYNKNVDKDYPASLSLKHIQNLKDIGCNDVLIISDDMDMGAITKQYSRKDALVNAINAGVDVLIISNNINSYDPLEFFTARKIVFDAVKIGDISESRINEAYQKIIEIKNSHGLLIKK